jgi:hypothetical protein
VTRSGVVRRMIDAAASDVRVPGERLTGVGAARFAA